MKAFEVDLSLRNTFIQHLQFSFKWNNSTRTILDYFLTSLYSPSRKVFGCYIDRWGKNVETLVTLHPSLDISASRYFNPSLYTVNTQCMLSSSQSAVKSTRNDWLILFLTDGAHNKFLDGPLVIISSILLPVLAKTDYNLIIFTFKELLLVVSY